MILAFLSSRTVQRVLWVIPAAILLFVLLRSAPLDPLMMPGNPPPTYDARDPKTLCDDLNSAWDNDWPRVIYDLEKVRERQATCNGQDPLLTLYPAYYNYGAWLERRGDIAGAIAAYRKALEFSPQGVEAAQALQRRDAFTPAPLVVCGAQMIKKATAAVPIYLPHGKSGFARIESGGFVIDGAAYRPHGINYYPARAPWRRFLLEADPASVARELDLLGGAGIDALRIFVWYDALFDCPGSGAVPKPEAVARLDAVIRLAAQRGFRLIVTLNDLPDLTIRPLYRYPDVAAAQTAYIVSRYRDEPTILAWDVRNEGDIDYGKGIVPSKLVLGWLAQTAAQIRALDPNHLITAGWNENAQATAEIVDFVSFHHWSDWQNLRQRIADLRTYTQKPILLEEVGYSTLGLPEAQQSDKLREVLTAADQEGLAGWLLWTAFDFSTDVTCLPPACPSLDNGEHHFGLWRADYTPKPAVEMLKAFTVR
jgi:Cellulase (glycosyl hydrolase family 5)